MAISRKQYGWGAVIVGILLIAFLFYYFKMRNKKEKCPDGSDIPDSGNCVSSSGIISVGTIKADANGCIQPSTYYTNHFPLSLAMRGDLVKQLQKGLNSSFNAKLIPDGFFGCNTNAALLKALSVTSIDAQLFKDKILTPAGINPPAAFTQTMPIDVNGCDANGLNADGFPCLA